MISISDFRVTGSGLLRGRDENLEIGIATGRRSWNLYTRLLTNNLKFYSFAADKSAPYLRGLSPCVSGALGGSGVGEVASRRAGCGLSGPLWGRAVGLLRQPAAWSGGRPGAKIAPVAGVVTSAPGQTTQRVISAVMWAPAPTTEEVTGASIVAPGAIRLALAAAWRLAAK